MRILLIHQAFASPQEGGGTRHYEFGQHLIRSGHEFTVVTSNLSYLTGQHVLELHGIMGEQDLGGIRVLRAYTLPTLHRSFAWRIIAFLSFMAFSVVVALRAGPVDLVIGTSPPIFQAFSAWCVALVRRRPFLIEVRDLWPEFAIDMGVLKNPLLIRLSRWLEAFLYNRADHILVNSPAYSDYLINRSIPAHKVSLIPNGVDPDMFDPDADGHAIRQRFDLGDKFVVIYAGALGQANDIITILNAAKILGDNNSIHFLLAGDGKERVKLENLANKYGLKNVTFAGAVPKVDMHEFLAASDICVATLMNIPMFKTTYPNKVFDYMAAGKPTILCIDGVIRDVIESAQGGIFVNPGSGEQLADAVMALYRDRNKVQEMGEAARNYVMRHFNRNDQARAFEELITRLT